MKLMKELIAVAVAMMAVPSLVQAAEDEFTNTGSATRVTPVLPQSRRSALLTRNARIVCSAMFPNAPLHCFVAD